MNFNDIVFYLRDEDDILVKAVNVTDSGEFPEITDDEKHIHHNTTDGKTYLYDGGEWREINVAYSVPACAGE